MAVGNACNCLLLRHDVIAVVFGYLGVDEVARLLCTSKHCQQQVLQHLRGTNDAARKLVLAAAQDAAKTMASNKSWKSRQSTSADQALQRFRFLTNQDILPEDVDIMEDLIYVPNIPAVVAATLVEAGQRVSYQQLLSAVHATVPGVEVWVKVYRHLKILSPAELHPAAEALCCDEELDPHELLCKPVTPDTLMDLLHFALAMPRVGTASSSLLSLCQLPAAAELTSRRVVQLVQAAIQAGVSDRLEHLMEKLPAASTIPVEQLMALIQSAMAAKLFFAARVLCQCPAAEGISVSAAKQMLQDAMQIEGGGGVMAASYISAAQQLTPQEVLQLMHEAVHCKELEKLLALRHLKAVYELSASDMAGLLSLAVATGCSEKVQALCVLPSAERLGMASARELLEAAQQCSDPEVASVMVSAIPAAQMLKIEASRQRQRQAQQ